MVRPRCFTSEWFGNGYLSVISNSLALQTRIRILVRSAIRITGIINVYISGSSIHPILITVVCPYYPGSRFVDPDFQPRGKCTDWLGRSRDTGGHRNGRIQSKKKSIHWFALLTFFPDQWRTGHLYYLCLSLYYSSFAFC